MSDNNHLDEETQIAIFQSMCPAASTEQARESLTAAGGDVDLAVTLFVSTASEDTSTTTAGGASQQQQQTKPARVVNNSAPQPSSSGNRPGHQYYVGGSVSGQAVIEPPKKASAGAGKSAVGRVNNSNTAESSEEDEDGEGGGGGGGAGSSAIKSLFNKARDNGAVEGGASSSANANNTVAFSGHGRRLGHTEGQSPAIAPVVRNERSVKLNFYKNGFTVDDDTNLRPMDGDAEKEFLETLNRGFIPRELSQRYPGTSISVVLADHGDEEYTPPAYVAFSGSGNRLAVASPTTTPTPAVTSSPPATTTPSTFEVREDEPTGKILLLTPDNRRVERVVNPDRHTIGDIRYGILRDIIPGLVPDRADLLLRNVPPRPLKDDSITIRAANAVNGVIMIKIRM